MSYFRRRPCVAVIAASAAFAKVVFSKRSCDSTPRAAQQFTFARPAGSSRQTIGFGVSAVAPGGLSIRSSRSRRLVADANANLPPDASRISLSASARGPGASLPAAARGGRGPRRWLLVIPTGPLSDS